MNVTALQRIDRWVGVPVCFVLTWLREVIGDSIPRAGTPIRKLLFIKLAEQGSTVLACPAIREAIRKVGREQVYFVVFEDNRFILDVMGLVPEENVITISFESLPAMVRSAWLALGRLRRLKLDAAIDLEFFTRGSAALTYLTGARRRVGFHPFFGAGPYRGNLMTHRLLYNPRLHTAQTFQLMVQALDQDPATLPTMDLLPPAAQEPPPQFMPRAEEVEAVREMLVAALPASPRAGGRPGDDYWGLILLNPNASDLLPLRRWPSDRYVQLARRLLTRYPNTAIVFTGAPAEAATSAQLAQEVEAERCVSLAGKTTLRQLLVLFTLADVLVTNDSGPAHFATLTPIRVVTLFGPETPALYEARSPRNVPLWAGIACSPCVNAYNNRQSPCRNNLCMQALTLDEVFEEVCRACDQQASARTARTA
ncbi:MAG: glycosyltransferase family 9 protein [Verrucomicrobia bacterium]|nr:MAG: glycosyltransferase family 9 protein [Verrucomicrobiota bacterium]